MALPSHKAKGFCGFLVELLRMPQLFILFVCPSDNSVDMIIISQSSDLLLVLSLHATCTHILERVLIKNGCCLVEQARCRNIPTGKMGTTSCPPTGASYHVTQPAVEIQLHLLHSWCFHLAFQGTEKQSGRESSLDCSLRRHMKLAKTQFCQFDNTWATNPHNATEQRKALHVLQKEQLSM